MGISDTVMHETYGTGVIQDIDGQTATVRFGTGLIKKVNLSELESLLLS